MSSMRELASRFGKPLEDNPSRVESALYIAGEGQLGTAERRFNAFMQAVHASTSSASQVVAHSGAFFRSWDETKLIVSTEGPTVGQVHHQAAHIMASVLAFGVLISLPAAAGLRRPILIIGKLPVNMRPVAQQTGEVFSKTMQLVMGAYFRAMTRVPRMTIANTVDRAGANFRAAKGEEAQSARSAPTAADRIPQPTQGCKIHDTHHCQAESLSVIPRVIPRLAKLLGSLSFTGTMVRLRAIQKEQLVI
jgi:hypothetical protein